MKNLSFYLLFVAVILISCKNSAEKEEQTSKLEETATVYGEEFPDRDVLSSAQMQERYRELEKGDTLEVSFRTTVNTVCKNKGCWMELDLPEDEDVMVKFRDYGFFVPKDIDNKEVEVNGKAYVTEVPVEEQRHYAEDMGKSPEEVMNINSPKKTYSFMADGVKIKE
jgi:hypothetical protein